MPALDEDMVAQRDPDRFAGTGGLRRRRRPPLDRRDPRGLVMRRKDELIPDSYCPRLDSARKDAAVIHPVNVLDRETQREFGGGRTWPIQSVQRLQQVRSAEPGHRAPTRSDHILAAARRNRNKGACCQSEALQESAIFRLDLPEAVFRKAGQIHFVHRDNHLAQAEETEQLSVPAALLAHTFIRRDHHDRGIGAGRPGDHVLQEFLMAGRIDDDVVAPGAPKLNLRRIDRDVLLLLLGERIEDKGVFERLALRRARLPQALDFPVRQANRSRSRIRPISVDLP